MSAACLIGLGALKPIHPVLAWDAPFLVPGLYLAGTLLLGALAIAVFNKWRTRRTPTTDANDQLAQFRSLYERGVISQEEFDRLRSLLGGQLRRSLEVPPAPRPGAPASEQVKPAASPPSAPASPNGPEGGTGPTNNGTSPT